MLISLSDSEGMTVPRFYELGDVVFHRIYNYCGVVIAMDRFCQAGDSWYYANKTQPPKNQPWYHLLVHQSGGLSTYVAQSNLEAYLLEKPIEHPRLGVYFQAFKDGRYVPHPADSGSCSI